MIVFINVCELIHFRPNPQPSSSNDDRSSKQPKNDKPPAIEEKCESVREKAEHKLSDLKTKIEESQTRAGHVGDNLRGYALNRFISYIKNYDQVLEKKFPGAMKVYRVFMDGVKFFGRDSVDYVKIRSRMVIQGKEIETLTRRELELYYQMPSDIRKVGPIILISAIPFAHYLTMPIA